MSDAPKRGRGRPAKYSKEEAQLRKREQDRLRAYNHVRQLPKVKADLDPPRQATLTACTDPTVPIVPTSLTVLLETEPTVLRVGKLTT